MISFSSRPAYIQLLADLWIVGCIPAGLHPEVNLAARMVLLWSLLMLLWLPWCDDGSGYCPLFISQGKVVPRSLASSFPSKSASPNAPFSSIMKE
ncbi:MAG TPA: hypothetical protein VMM54_07335 [Nitrospirota bacterium]|nr:hypothetical protein [Nitrospirota bacterium]